MGERIEKEEKNRRERLKDQSDVWEKREQIFWMFKWCIKHYECSDPQIIITNSSLISNN